MQIDELSILSVGNLKEDKISNTCLHRTWALKQWVRSVDMIHTRGAVSLVYRIANRLFNYGLPVYLPDTQRANRTILHKMKEKRYDILWIDKGITIFPRTLESVRQIQPGCLIVGYSPDEMTLRHNQSLQFIRSMPYYDYYFTTKSYAVKGLVKMGAKNVIFVDNSYEDRFHFPHILDEAGRRKLGGEVGFIGMWEEDRAEHILYLAQHGVSVRVWGGGEWLKYKNLYPTLRIEDHGLFSEDYSQALSAFKIGLCFLRKMNFDQQTTRTMEIPACGSMMIAERTEEHERLFKEGEEAEYFSSKQELLEKCCFYLTHEEQRVRISAAGYQRCITSGYSNKARVKQMLDIVAAGMHE